jgi:RNA polymerase sigma-70 factor (ECF subfamily)
MSGHQPPVTRFTLIGALRQGLRWEEFVVLYGRLILAWGRRDFGLQQSDADNLCQEVLIKVWKNIGGYDPARGRFRNWLYICTKNTVLNFWRGRHGERVGKDIAGLKERLQGRPTPRPAAWDYLPEDAGLEEALRLWEEEGCARDGLQEAVLHVRARVQPPTWKAFLLFEFFEMSAKEIAPNLGLTPAAVNQAVHRVRHLLRQALAAPRARRPGLREANS